MGVPEEDLPQQFRDVEIARSKKGKAGQIVVHQLSGVQKTSAAQLARKLENELSDGRDDVIEKLQASGHQTQELARLIDILHNNPQFTLARAIAEAKADVASVLNNYAKGALALKKLEVVLDLYKEMPHLMRDLVRHAVDKETDCAVCFGIGKVTRKSGGKSLTQPCPGCGGSGRTFHSSEHKAFAVGKLLEVGEMLPKKAGLALNVNQAVQVNQGSGGNDVLSRLSKAADEILYGKRASDAIIDAEVVEGGKDAE